MARILLVEDDPLVGTTLRFTLESGGHTVTVCINGRAALDAMRGGGVFDLVITDILMPDMDWLELIRALRGEAPGLRVIAMSGGGRRGNQDFLQFAEAFGADAVLAKPFAGDVLLRAVQQALAQAK